MNKGLIRAACLATIVTLAGASAASAADSFPERPVRLVVPFPAGSAADGLARFLADEVAPALGQSLIVTNKAGAQGAIGASEVARAAPDGYTLLTGTNSTQAANLYLSDSLAYDPKTDFAAITQLIVSPLVLVVRDDFPAADLPSFLEYAKSRPGELNYGIANTGSQASSHMLNEQAGLKAVGINYPGSPQAVTDLLGGHLQYLITDVSVARPHIEGGKLKALGVTTAQRIPALENVPTLSEAGLPGYEYASSWVGLYAPAGTPRPILEKLNKAFVTALKSEASQQFMTQRGLMAMPRDIEAFATYTTEEQAHWKIMLEAAGIAR